MTKQEKIEHLISPENFFPADVRLGSLLGNKPFIDAVEHYRDILSESSTWSKAQIEHIQIQRVRNLFSCISNRSPFWADYLVKYGVNPEKLSSLDDLKRLPVLRKDSLVSFGNKIYLSPLFEELPIFSIFSAGTVGMPFKMLYSERQKIISIPFLFRHPPFQKQTLRQILSRKSFVVLGLSGFRNLYEKDFFNHVFTSLQPSDLYKKGVREKIYNKIREAAPTLLAGYGSLIAGLARVVAEDRIKLPLYGVRITSEPISLIERELIKQVFEVPLVENYHNSIGGNIGFSCPRKEGFFHVNSEAVILEALDENGIPVPEGEEGELVATSTAWTITPVIRCSLNDVGSLFLHKCFCGSNLPLVKFSGRRGYEIILPSGRKIRMIHIYSSLMANAGLGRLAKQFQIIQNCIDNLLLLIVPRKKVSDTDEIKIRLAITELFDGEKMNIEIKCVDVIPSSHGHKLSMFVPLSEFQEKKL